MQGLACFCQRSSSSLDGWEGFASSSSSDSTGKSRTAAFGKSPASSRVPSCKNRPLSRVCLTVKSACADSGAPLRVYVLLKEARLAERRAGNAAGFPARVSAAHLCTRRLLFCNADRRGSYDSRAGTSPRRTLQRSPPTGAATRANLAFQKHGKHMRRTEGGDESASTHPPLLLAAVDREPRRLVGPRGREECKDESVGGLTVVQSSGDERPDRSSSSPARNLAAALERRSFLSSARIADSSSFCLRSRRSLSLASASLAFSALSACTRARLQRNASKMAFQKESLKTLLRESPYSHSPLALLLLRLAVSLFLIPPNSANENLSPRSRESNACSTARQGPLSNEETKRNEERRQERRETKRTAESPMPSRAASLPACVSFRGIRKAEAPPPPNLQGLPCPPAAAQTLRTKPCASVLAEIEKRK